MRLDRQTCMIQIGYVGQNDPSFPKVAHTKWGRHIGLAAYNVLEWDPKFTLE